MQTLNHITKKIFLAIFVFCFVASKAQNPLTYSLSTQQSVPIDENKRAQNAIYLKSGFKYGQSVGNKRLTLEISKYPSYVENGYDEFITSCSRPTQNNPLVGEIEGAFSVSLSGSAMYEIPLKMSPGTAGMQPNLKLIYSSGSGSNMMGIGWNLSGLSVISRVNKLPYLDGKYDAVKLNSSDVFALDGNRLLLKSGTYGAGSSIYGTEQETFAQITAISQQGLGPQSFIVVDKNGTTTEYGNTTDSKLTGIGDNTALVWYVNKVTDIFGNYLTYTYKQLNGEVVIDKIQYTGNTAAGLTPDNEISFEYINKTEKNTTYIGDKEFKTTQLLKSITAKSNGVLVKKYVLNYQYSYNTILSDIVEVNKDGTEVRPTVFCYNDPFYNSAGEYGSQNTQFYTGASAAAKYADLKQLIPADMNGDGFSDAVIVQPNNKYDVLINDYPSSALNGGDIGFTSVYNSANAISSNTVLGSFVLDSDFDDKHEVYTIIHNTSINNVYQIQKLINTSSPGTSIQVSQVTASITLTAAINPSALPSKFYYDKNDYNGDGIIDELIIDPEKIIINSSLGNKTYAITSTSAVARPLDYDGDGFLEVVIFKDLITSLNVDIIKYTGGNLSLVHSTSIPFTGNTTQDLLKLISIGDYNGDGKTDLLYLDYLKQNLKIKHSTGSAFSTPKTVSSFIALNSAINYNIASPDINGDGISDIIFTENTGSGVVQNYIAYYSIGDQFIKGFNTTGKFNNIYQSLKYFYTYKGVYNEFYKTEKIKVYEYSVDFNGDGVYDVVSIDGTSTNAILNNALSSKTLYLKQITTGLHKQIDIVYSNSKTKFDNQKISVYQTKAGTYTGPLVSFTPGNYLVSEVKHRNSGDLINLSQTVRYFYQGAIFHQLGKGFLGFENSGWVNLNKGLGSISSFIPNTTYHVPQSTKSVNTWFTSYPLGGITYYGIGDGGFDDVSSSVTTNYQITPTTGSAIFVAPSSIDSKDFLSSTASVTNYSYDLTKHGNLTSESTTWGWPTSGTTKTEITNYTYQNIGTVPNLASGIFKPQTQTYTSTQLLPTANPAYSRQTDFTYDGQKHLTSIIKDQNLSGLTTTTSFTNFNTFGAPQKTEITASGILTRKAETIFDSKGRFVIKTINAKGDEENFVYDAKYGNLLEKKDISGLISKYSYDGLGRLIQTILPDNTTNTIEYEYSSATDNVYSKTVNNEGEPYFKTFYNHLGDVTNTETIDVNGNTIVTEHKYDFYTGNLIKSTEPHFVSQTLSPNYLATVFTYEPTFNRLKREETHLVNASSPGSSIFQNIFTEYDYNLPSKDYFNGSFLYTQGFIAKKDQTYKQVKKFNNDAGQTTEVRNLEHTGSPTVYQAAAYDYFSHGNPQTIVLTHTNNSDNIIHSFNYNSLAQQTQLIDPSAGTINYSYNVLGELLHKDDATGTTDYTYDNLGRLETKTGSVSGTTTYQYVTANSGKNQIETITGPNVTTNYSYDNLGRTTSFEEILGGSTPKTFVTLYEYDAYSNLTKYTYPSGFITKFNYSNGYMNMITDDANNMIWKLNDQNAIGQITDFDYGNGINTINQYTNLHYLTTTEHGNIHKQEYDFNPLTGNLTQRDVYNFLTGTHNQEKFTFDALDRLRNSEQFDPSNSNLIYANPVTIDEKGNITQKSDAGDFKYTDVTKPFTLTQIDNPTPNIPLNTISATYNDLRKVSQLTESVTNKEMNFIYGNDDERIKVDYLINSSNEYTRYYQANYDLEEKANGDVTEWNYIYAPSGLVAIYHNQNNNGQLLYAITDHLGSPLLLTDQSQLIQEEYSFDSWGRRRNPVDWTYNLTSPPTLLHRGYTFHEHIDEFNFINMNGRIYDPLLGRFIQPDNYVQAADKLQNFNRYAYVYNNPLKFTDPNGQVIVGAILLATIAAFILVGGISQVSGHTSSQTFAYASAAAIAVSSIGVGNIAAGGIAFGGNTTALVIGSAFSTAGQHIVSGGQSDIEISLGVISYDLTNGEFGYIAKKDNTIGENIGYTLGALTNISDLLAGLNSTSVKLNTENDKDYSKIGDPIGHSQLERNGDILIDYGPLDDVATNCYELGTPVKIHDGAFWQPVDIQNVNINSIYKYRNYLDGNPGKYHLLTSNCVNKVSNALNMGGVYNVGIHPYLLQTEMVFRNAGIRPIIGFSNYLINKH